MVFCNFIVPFTTLGCLYFMFSFSDLLNHSYYYIDTEGNVISNSKFSFANPFCEGLAACVDAETGKMGFIDTNGNWAISPEYDAGGSFWFINGICNICEIDGHVTIINRNGAKICEYLIQ